MSYVAGKGTTVGVDWAGGSSYTTVAQVTTIKPPGVTNEPVETTHLSSTWKTRIATIPDGGELSFTVEYDGADSGHIALSTNCALGTIGTWLVTLSDGTAITHAGILTKFEPQDHQVDNISMWDATVQVTGAITIA